jgi:hypothetical protein
MAARRWLIEDEFRAVLDKCAIPNATLPKVICKLWSRTRAGVSDKKGVEECDGKLCILGNIPCEDAADFAKAFGSSTTKGMYDRFLFGYDTTAVKYRPLDIHPTVFPDSMVVRVPEWVWDAKDQWAGDKPERRRLTEHALRVALVSTACNGEKEISAASMTAAFRMAELQERIRNVFKPGLAETKDAEAYEAIHAGLVEQRMHQLKTQTFPKGADLTGWKKDVWWGMLNYRDIMTARNYYRKYGTMVGRVKSMMETFVAVEQSAKEIGSQVRGGTFLVRNRPRHIVVCAVGGGKHVLNTSVGQGGDSGRSVTASRRRPAFSSHLF